VEAGGRECCEWSVRRGGECGGSAVASLECLLERAGLSARGEWSVPLLGRHLGRHLGQRTEPSSFACLSARSPGWVPGQGNLSVQLQSQSKGGDGGGGGAT